MQKIQIRAVSLHSSGFFWSVVTPLGQTNYIHSAGAFTYAQKYCLKHRKEMSAFSILARIIVNLLTVEEAELVAALRKNSCKGITKAQYGWLVGIYERQERAW